jgi:ABC-type multidrug transport system ATPase subunit
LLDKKDAKLIQLSDSELNVASFIKATIHEPKLLLWDNPFQNIAKEYHHFMMKEIDALKQGNALIVCFTSDLSIARKLDLNIEILDQSKLEDVA